jgi:L-amino acid N-acyltransferase YncA
MIRNASASDARQLCDIYNHYVINSTVTFEEEPISTKEMSDRIDKVHSRLPWLVYEKENEVIGYAYATEWRSRIAYRYSAETTVYLKPGMHGKGIGSLLYKALIETIKPFSIHTLIGGIALPNDSSIALHEKLGFEKVAHFKEVGFKMNKWIDVGYWQLLLKK